MAKIQRTDFILNEDGDFPLQDTVVGGVWLDTPFGLSDPQHMKDLLFYDLGHLTQSPVTGVGVSRYLNSEYKLQEVEDKVRSTFDKDDYNVYNGIVTPVPGGGFIINTVDYAERK